MDLSLHFEQSGGNEVCGCQESLGEKHQSETSVTAGCLRNGVEPPNQ